MLHISFPQREAEGIKLSSAWHGAPKCVWKICQNIYEREALRNEENFLHKILIFLRSLSSAVSSLELQWVREERRESVFNGNIWRI